MALQCGRWALCPALWCACGVVAVGAAGPPKEPRSALGGAGAACARRLRDTDFALDRFQNGWMDPENISAFSACLYQLRTKRRPQRKSVYAGGVHYPTLIVAHHTSPPVSTAGAQWCWLDESGRDRNGLDPKVCCDTVHGPEGLEACWDGHFTYALCCLGDVHLGEVPHFFVAPALDINVGNAVRQLGTFDLGQSYALQTLCKRGDVVLDIGANVGGFTVPLAERVGPSGEVHAFEPFRKVYQHLNANVALNGLANVYTYNLALGVEEKTMEVHTPDLTTWNFPSAMRVAEQYDPQDAVVKANLRYEPRRERITIRPLDSIDFAGRVRLIKIDVEFMELQVVLGGLETIRRHRPVMWVENEPYFDDPPNRQFVETMDAELGYHCRPVARLELLCLPQGGGSEGLPEGFQRVFRHLTGEIQDLNLWRALSEVDPGFAAVA
mmetsp:Transcript_21765/g.61790  ORF Transcript_21765/g.61790 Transcript_21765/m.61790 type:complete len:439 (-) Transcript_21765:54-1370(-)